MGLLSDLLLLPVTGPTRGLLFIAEQIRDQVDEERFSSLSHINDELMTLAMSYERGELTEEAYIEQESALLERLDSLRSEQEVWEDTEQTEEIEDETDEAANEPEHTEHDDAP